MIKRIKPISKSVFHEMVYQIRYLINEKHVSYETFAWHLKNMLSDKGIPFDYVPLPWNRKDNQ